MWLIKAIPARLYKMDTPTAPSVTRQGILEFPHEFCDDVSHGLTLTGLQLLYTTSVQICITGSSSVDSTLGLLDKVSDSPFMLHKHHVCSTVTSLHMHCIPWLHPSIVLPSQKDGLKSLGFWILNRKNNDIFGDCQLRSSSMLMSRKA